MGLSVAFDRFSQFDVFIHLKNDLKMKKRPLKGSTKDMYYIYHSWINIEFL